MMKTRTYFVSMILITIMLLGICTQTYAENHIHTWRVDFCIDCGERREVFQHGMWKYVFLTSTNEIEIVGYTDGETDASIPEQIDGVPVTSIGGTAFWGCNSLTSITIPDSVTSIAGNPFRHSTAQIKVSPTHPTFTVLNGVLFEKPTKRLVAYPYWADATSWDIPQGIVEIGDYAFYSCEILTSINIPDSVTSVGNYAFYDCGLLSITIPDGVTSIGNEAFSSCRSLTSITIPDSVKSIGDRAFYSCRHLTDIVIPDGVTSIGDDVFSYCDMLTTITIPDSVTSIGINPFHGSNIKIQISSEHPAYTLIDGALFDKANKQLISYSSNTDAVLYDIPQGTLGIGARAFEGSRNLTSISIPDSVTFIGNCAFDLCSSLTNITIPEGVTSIDDCTFYGCKSLTSIVIPDGVTSIGYRAFSDCESLTSITVPDGVTSVGNVAFADCYELKSVVLPDSVTFIGVNAFSGCRKLTATVTKNSYSEQYCIKNDINYIYPDTYDWLKS